jgi:hypothetical protein
MSCLAPCPACNRHVATEESTCPFCSAALPDSIRCQPRPRPRGRLSRAAMLAAGAALIGTEACSSAVAPYGTSPPPPDAAADGGTMDGGPVALYGAAPAPMDPAALDESAKPPTRSKS